jgi:hypothetical protein
MEILLLKLLNYECVKKNRNNLLQDYYGFFRGIAGNRTRVQTSN